MRTTLARALPRSSAVGLQGLSGIASTAMVAHRGRDRPWISALACRMVPAVRRFIVSSVVACALVLPFVLWGFRTYQLAFAGTHAIAIVGLNLIAGQAGLISLGHGAFYGLGGYTLAVMIRHAGAYACLGSVAAPLMGLAAGYLFGRVVARLTRFYLALATFALALAVPQTLKSSYLHPWTGGVQGLYLDRPGAPAGLPLNQDQWWYLVTLAILALLLWMARNLVAGRIGRAIRAMRDDPVAAQAAGIDLAHYTAAIFAVGRRTPARRGRSPPCCSISSRPRASHTGCRSSCWSARCSAG